MKKNNKKGFTLIELLLVVAIIGILAAVLSIGMGGQRERAKVVSTLESVRSALPYMVECYVSGNNVKLGVAGTRVCESVVGSVLPANVIEWPELLSDCSYTGGTISDYTADIEITSCFGKTEGYRVYCNINQSKCFIQ